MAITLTFNLPWSHKRTTFRIAMLSNPRQILYSQPTTSCIYVLSHAPYSCCWILTCKARWVLPGSACTCSNIGSSPRFWCSIFPSSTCSTARTQRTTGSAVPAAQTNGPSSLKMRYWCSNIYVDFVCANSHVILVKLLNILLVSNACFGIGR